MRVTERGTEAELVTEQMVLSALATIQDPDLHRDIVSLGFIKSLDRTGNEALPAGQRHPHPDRRDRVLDGGVQPEDEIVVYCPVGQRSAIVTEHLTQLGFKNVKNLLGGLDYWAQSVDPTMRRYGWLVQPRWLRTGLRWPRSASPAEPEVEGRVHGGRC